MITKDTLIAHLTVEEFLSLQNRPIAKKYEYGIKGIAKIFGCSRDKAQKIKNSGDIDEAILFLEDLNKSFFKSLDE